jgi:MATE family multidrug resistance protein
MSKKEESKEQPLDGIESAKSHEPIAFLHEAKLLFKIAIPTVLVQFSAYFIFPQTASAVGRNLGTEELAAFSLASLTGNMMCLSIIVGALSALDTLMPRAFGLGRYQEVGKLAIRGFIVTALVMCIPLIPLLTSVKRIFNAFGQDQIVSSLSSDWLRIYLFGVPFVLLYRVIQRFLACQQLVMPIAYAGLIGCFVVHPIILHYGIRSMGFAGSAVAVVTTQFVQAFLVVLYLRVRRVYHPETWSGISGSTIKGALEPVPMLHFFKLGMGGVVSLSEWWFWVRRPFDSWVGIYAVPSFIFCHPLHATTGDHLLFGGAHGRHSFVHPHYCIQSHPGPLHDSSWVWHWHERTHGTRFGL